MLGNAHDAVVTVTGSEGGSIVHGLIGERDHQLVTLVMVADPRSAG